MNESMWFAVVSGSGVAGAAGSVWLHAPQIAATPSALRPFALVGAAFLGFGLAGCAALILSWMVARQPDDVEDDTTPDPVDELFEQVGR